jgi:type III secretion protein N (ATPase)
MAKFQEVELLLRIGEYKKGSDPITDEAIAKMPAINAYLKQGLQEKCSYADAIKKIIQLVA